MDIDPLESVKPDESDEPSFAQFRKLNACVAITIALLATFMGICKVKDDNIVQSMQQAQANKLDHWNFYQARNIREEIAKGTLLGNAYNVVSADVDRSGSSWPGATRPSPIRSVC